MEHNLGNTPVQEERPGRTLIRRPPLVLLQAPVCRPIIGNAFPRERRRKRNDQSVQFCCVTSA